MATYTPSRPVISNELLAAVDRIAKRLGMSRNDVIRKALERYLEQECATLPAGPAAGSRPGQDW